MITVRLDSLAGTVATAHLSGSSLEADAYPLLVAARAQAALHGARALVLDLGAVGRVSPSGIGALVELAASRDGPELALCAIPATALSRIHSLGLDHALPDFTDRQAALASPAMMRHRLAGLRAVVLTGGTTTQPWADTAPGAIPDTDHSVLTRVLDQLANAGLGEAIVCTGHTAPGIAATLGERRYAAMPIFIRRDAGSPDGVVGSATTLGRLRVEGNLPGNALVLDGDALSDIDIAALYAGHCLTGADVTVAVPTVSPDEAARAGIIQANTKGRITAFPASTTPASSPPTHTGIFILSPRALACADTRAGMDIAAHLLPAILARGHHLQIMKQPFRWVRIDGQLRPALVAGLDIAHQDWAAE